MSWSSLKEAVSTVITDNGNNEITGPILKAIINNNLIPQLGGSLFRGVATPTTAPGTPEKKERYLAETKGIYPNFGGIEVYNEICFLEYQSTQWVKITLFEKDQHPSDQSTNLVESRGVFELFNSSEKGFKTLNDSNAIKASGLTFTLDNGSFNITKSWTFPWISFKSKRYQFKLIAQSRYLVIAAGNTSALAVTMDKTMNSCRIFRFNSDGTLQAVVSSLPNNLFTAGRLIEAFRVGTTITILENGVLKFTYDYSDSLEPEFSNPVFGNAFIANGIQLTGAKASLTESISSRLTALENGIVSVEDTTELVGQTMADVGDSLLDQNGTQPLIMARFGIASNQSLAVSGRRFTGNDASAITQQIQNISGSPKLILIGGGTNDFGNHVALGNQGSTDIAEFYGAINFVANYAVNNYPNSKLLWLGLPFGNWQNTNGFARGQINNLGLTRYDYDDALRKVTRDNGIMYVSQLNELPHNLQNIANVTSDGIHFNSIGSADREFLWSIYINLLFQ